MRQWSLRITEYAERLLKGLEEIDFSDSMKEVSTELDWEKRRAKITFKVKSEQSSAAPLTVFTTRPDTIFGVDFMVVPPNTTLLNR